MSQGLNHEELEWLLDVPDRTWWGEEAALPSSQKNSTRLPNPIETLDREKVEGLITIRAMAEKYGVTPIVVPFTFGRGFPCFTSSAPITPSAASSGWAYEMPSSSHFTETGFALDAAMEELPLAAPKALMVRRVLLPGWSPIKRRAAVLIVSNKARLPLKSGGRG